MRYLSALVLMTMALALNPPSAQIALAYLYCFFAGAMVFGRDSLATIEERK